MSKSIMQTKHECYLCGRQFGLERHHVLAGTANRKLSEKYGLWVYLCHNCHTGNGGAQYEKELNLRLKREAQEAFEREYDGESFRDIFGKNYL